MSETSTKPYLLRAIYEWCTDNGYTPHIAVVVDKRTRVPMEFVRNGEIVLNISFSATSGLKMDNEWITFNARFGGVSRELEIPVDNVVAIYARENGQGMAFEATASSEDAETEHDEAPGNAPSLSSVPTATAQESDQSDDPGTDPDPPKRGGRPTLTRIK
jgi:stringent starvation protein B